LLRVVNVHQGCLVVCGPLSLQAEPGPLLM
jgi:hypothetical protein